MNQSKVFQIGLVALCYIVGLANGKSQEKVCFPSSRVPYEPSHPVAPTNCSKHGVYIDYSDRSRYYVCNRGKLYNRKCPDGLWFDIVSKLCDWPENLACNPREKVCPYGSVPVPPRQPTVCSKSDRNYYSNPSDPSKYYQCYDGRRFDYSCVKGTYFDCVNIVCEWPEKMKCFDYNWSSN